MSSTLSPRAVTHARVHPLRNRHHVVAPSLRTADAAPAAVFAAWAKPVAVDRSMVISGQALEHQARSALAAALRELVGSNAYEVEGPGWYSLVIDVDDIYAIADELEGFDG
jgi:hypothetical protein